MIWIPEKTLDLIADETKTFTLLNIIMPDGYPQEMPFWFNAKDSGIVR